MLHRTIPPLFSQALASLVSIGSSGSQDCRPTMQFSLPFTPSSDWEGGGQGAPAAWSQLLQANSAGPVWTEGRGEMLSSVFSPEFLCSEEPGSLNLPFLLTPHSSALG